MKKFLCVFCSLAIMVMCLSGCGGNPFTADDAKKGQIGDLCYAVPGNAISKEDSNDDNIVYVVPIENSVEEYQLNIGCTYITKEDAESKEDILEGFDRLIEFIEEITNGSGVKYSREDIDEFAGTTVDKAIKISGEGNGAKSILIIALKSRNAYFAGYSTKTGFFDQSIWENFYKQLKYVGSDDTDEEEDTTTEEPKEDNFDRYIKEKDITLTYVDVQYDTPNHLDEFFSLVGYAELDDYYDLGYADDEKDFFCLAVTPKDDKYSDKWYVYCDRVVFESVFEKVKETNKLYVKTVCYIPEKKYEKNQQCMATLQYIVW